MSGDETTRLRAELAMATASVRQLRADVELATAQRDAEACRADDAEGEIAAVTRERDALHAERDGEHDLIARQAAILTAVADALKGTPSALMRHSHHDLGAVAAATVAQLAPLAATHDALVAAAHSAGWRDAGATPEELIAWVRRGERERCDDAITARLVEAVREVREKTYRGTGAEKDIATAVWEAIDAMRDTIREGGE